jgi:hypothetical protein
MAFKHFQFADFIDEFKVDFTVYDETPGSYNTVGKWIQGTKTPRTMQGIILPLTTDDLQFAGNGVYTSKDRKIYTTEPLKKGQKLEYEGQIYTIHEEKDYSAYADVYIYFAKGVST